MAQRKYRTPGGQTARRQLQAAETALRAAVRQAEEDIPMRRYSAEAPAEEPVETDCRLRESSVLLEQLLEETCRQSQLLLDLLAAVNSLTAATLARKGCE